MEWILLNWETVCTVFLALISIIFSFLNWRRTGSVRVSLKNFLDGENMIKPMSLKQAEKEKPAPQSFSEYKKDYVLNSATNELEVLPNPVNIQAKIDSYLECALDRVLERLTPNVVEERDTIQEDFQNSVDDLASLGEAMEVAEEWRDRLDLPASYNMAQIYAAVDERAQKLKKSLSDFGKKSEVKENEVSQEIK